MLKKSLLFIIFSFTSLFGSNPSSPVLLMIGTRPEAIKMFPVYKALIAKGINTQLCTTGQHGEMVEELLQLVGITPDYDFKIMKPNQDLFYITQSVLEKTKELIKNINPAFVIVQGDTTTALASALAAFYLKIPVAHIEAGLRSGNIHAPFPEELNRRWITSISSIHFAPTLLSVNNLINEGVKPEEIFCTGNTVVDALYTIQAMIFNRELTPSENLVSLIENLHLKQQKTILLTAHRRESFDGGLYNIFIAAKQSLINHPNLSIIYPMHPNPLIREIAGDAGLFDLPNLHILPPLCYHDMAYLLNMVDGVMTDSGGIQEEAISLCKPVLVLRNETDRPEGLIDGNAVLVGTTVNQSVKHLDLLIDSVGKRNSSLKRSIYGNGQASQQIAEIIQASLENSQTTKEK